METLGHNPNADEAERLRVRAGFDVKAHLAGQTPAPASETPVHITKEQVLTLCGFYGIDVIDQTSGPSGRRLNIEERLEELKAQLHEAHTENGRLEARAVLAEEIATKLLRDIDAQNVPGNVPQVIEENS